MILLKKLGIILIMGFVFFSLTKNILDYRAKLRFFEDYKHKVEVEEKRNITLKTEILKSKDPYRLEKTIRDKLNLERPNEVAVILPQPTPTPVVVIPTPAPVWKQWWNLFF